MICVVVSSAIKVVQQYVCQVTDRQETFRDPPWRIKIALVMFPQKKLINYFYSSKIEYCKILFNAERSEQQSSKIYIVIVLPTLSLDFLIIKFRISDLLD